MPLPDNRISWSDSRIKAFKKCPFQFQQITLKKIAPFVQTEAMKEGERQHKMLENRIASDTPLPPGYEYLEPMSRNILAAPGQRYTEIKLAVDRNHIACGYKDWDRAEGRAIGDIMIINNASAWIGDYKSGTPTADGLQLKITAALLFQSMMVLNYITTSYIWLKTGKLDPSDSKTWMRAQLPQLWREIDAEVERLQEAARLGIWPKRPGRHCRWCQVNAMGLCDAATEKYRD